MSAAETPSKARATRSKRTRQPAANDDSVKQPLQKKRRAALRRDTFEPLTDASLNEIAGRDSKPEKTNGHTDSTKQHSRTSSQARELTLRGAKKSEKRPEKGGGQLLLSSNEFYTVAQLPSLPDQIRSHPSMPYSCVISPEHDLVLALTHHDAYIWPYNSSASIPSSRDLVYLKLPFPPSTADDPLPLAAFTAKAANGEPGIVAVSPKWGKIIYWESISEASSFVPGQTGNSVQGSVPGMLNGEIVKELVKAEPAGYVLTFNFGRVAHLTIRDQVGRPGIGVQFMRKSTGNSSKGGFLGSIRNVFGGDRRKGTPIVRAGKSAKAQREVVIGTEDGGLEFWNINLSVGNSLSRTLTLTDELLAAMQTVVPSSTTPLQIRMHDLELMATPASSHEIAKRGDAGSIPLLALLSTTNVGHPFFLVEIVITGDVVNVQDVHPLSCYKTDIIDSTSWRPRLCIPPNQPMAFILFETAVILASLVRIRESPSSQLLMEKSDPPERFQDCIRFQDDTIYKVLACATEQTDSQAACVFVVQGFGVVKILSKLQADSEIDVEDLNSRIGPKSKIEQAVFFGTMRHNPLELRKASGETFSSDEIEKATLQIGEEILASSSRYLPKSALSLENQLKLRAKALEDLVGHVLKVYPSAISRDTRFQLLWNAEKLAAAQAIWKVQENIQRTYPRKDDRETTYMDFCLHALHESRQKYPNAQRGETDRVRHWLINSVANVEHLLSELVSCFKDLDDMDVRDPRIICDYFGEAIDLWTAAYQSAFRFREDHAPSYGLGDEVYKDGVHQTAYPQTLPHPWTSKEEPFRFGQRLIYDVCTFLNDWWDYQPEANGASKDKKGAKQIPTDLNGNTYDIPVKDALLDLAARLPHEVELFSRMVREENIQAVGNAKHVYPNTETQQAKVDEIKQQLRPRIAKAITAISRFNMPGAIELGEKMQDPGLLVSLNQQYLIDLEIQAHLHPEDRALLEAKKGQVQAHAETYFDTIGNGWAFAHFSNLVEDGLTGTLLGEAQANGGRKQKHLNWFLKKAKKVGQQVSKISWINDVVGERKYDRAQSTLESIATDEETDIWAKKTELCLAKLAGMAAIEGPPSSDKARSQLQPDLGSKYDDSLALLDIQESLSIHITAAASNAIDEDAARELAFDMFGRHVVEKKPALKRLLLACLASLLENQSLTPTSLVSALTLIDPVEFAGLPEDDPGVQGREFGLALQILNLSSESSMDRVDADALRMLVFRRAILRDDWVLLNNTSGKSDQEVMNQMQMSAIFRALLDVFQARLDDQTNLTSHAPAKPLKLFSPQEILAAQPASLLTTNLKEKYLQTVAIDGASADGKKFLKQLEDEMTKEHDILKKYVEKAQVSNHWECLVKDAETSVYRFAEANGHVHDPSNAGDGLNGINQENIVPSVEMDEDKA